MAKSEAGQSIDAAPRALGHEYEVFLSFRGLATRHRFTDFLYHNLVNAGVRVFRDKEEPCVGEVIGEDLLRAINNSILHIPIFSQTYVSSKWCLRELALMVDKVSMSERKKSILPIFLDVEPEDVELKTPLYSSALLEHEKKFPLEVEAWRAALAEVGKIKGWNWKKGQSQATIIKLVVEEVLEKLITKRELVTEHLVGIDDQIKDLIELLDVNHPDTRLIIIHGMGGIGKTTVAKVIFNQLSSYFEKCCSFLEDVRASSSTEEGIVELQKELLSDVVGSESAEKFKDSEQGMWRIGEILNTKKVLVVLDDVDREEHIKKLIGNSSLHLGSRIIITTRNVTILQVEEFEGKILPYEILKMDDGLALQLFCRHAFGRDFPPDDYHGLSCEIVSSTEGIPLVIEVIGLFLNWEDKATWKETLVKLRNVPPEKILEKLRISYDGLDFEQKQVFLDIACFFVFENKTHAIYMWDSCQLNSIRGIKILTERCLIKVVDNGKFWMHDELIALGRQIVRQDSLGDLGQQSRLWNAKEALKIIRTKEKKAKVRALEIDGLDDSRKITNKELQRLPNLKLLKLDNGTYAGDFTECHSQLRWISWRSPHQDFRVDNLYLDHLVVFKLDNNGFMDDSKAWDLIKRAKNLKVLSLTECHGITTIPDLSKCLGLERLSLAYCSKLKKIESFIGSLQSLIELKIEECNYLTDLPEEIGALVKFKHFSLSGCRRLRKLPGSIGNLTSLMELDLSGTIIRELPNSIGKLKSLRILRFPVKSPVDWKNHDRQLPSSIGTLENLEELDLSGHNEMKGEIPVGIGELSYLRILNLESTGICEIPRTINMLHHLETLNLSHCNAIQELPELPTSLTHLHIKYELLLSVPNLSNLTNLAELLLSDVSRFGKKSNLFTGHNLRWIRSLSSLKKLTLNLPNVYASLELASFSHMEELDLKHLDPKPFVQLLSSYCSWRNLSTLEFYQCEVEAIPLERLPQLEKLIVDGCKQLEILSIPLELRKLRQAWVSRCPELVEIQVAGCSKSLESLRVSRCKSLIRIGGLSDLKNLEELVIQRCNVLLTNVEGLHELESLKSLVVKKCTSLRWLTDASCTNIPTDCLVEIWGCGDFIIKQGATFLKRYREEILLNTSNKSMEKMKDEATQRAADMETSDRNYAIAAVQTLVGIDDSVKQITELLEMEVIDEVRVIGIYGTDGIGKTTLAKAVYDRISSGFDSCSFLAEVKESTQNPRGIHFLQTKLIHDILDQDRDDPSLDETIQFFLGTFREMKVLIGVDDVEEQSHLHAIVGDQLHWFGPGSRIIVTSENKEILKGYDPEKVRTYMVSELDDVQAFELFCKHAFGMQFSMRDYDGLANSIVNALEKLPLAVEVVGSFLRGKSIQEWEKMEESMKPCTTSSQKTTFGLEEILDICYKELDQQQKDIFLDIACCFSGVDARIASYMWPNCYLPSSDCILMPLAKIGENNELQMHRLLRCLGKRILNQEGSGDPIGRKFYVQDMVPKATNWEKGMENAEALCFDFTAGDFQSMPDIRFLKLDNAKVSGNFAGAFASLRWLCWQSCPLEFDASDFVLRKLVILDLSWSKVTEDWGGWSEIKMEKLKVLNLTGCSDLLITPNFSDYKDLEILILERCSRLVKLDASIGYLKRLVSLNLKFCSQLNVLPVELGCMTALKELFIDRTSVREIPISIGNLKQLEILSGFKCFPLTHVPNSIGYLTALSELSLDGTKITELPSSMGELLKLRRLSLRDCRSLEELPDSIGKIRSLEVLDTSATGISRLPYSIRNLQNLRVLRMDSSFIRAFPGEIGNLIKLEELHASWCRSLKGAIPSDIKELHNLRSLTLRRSSISSLPSEISTISSLHTLDLLQCNEIEELPKLPPSLICLRVSSKRMKAIPFLKVLKELEELCLSDGEPEARRPPSKQLMPESNMKQMIGKQSFSISFPKLRKLELSLSQIFNLQFVYEPTDIPELKMLTLSGRSLEEVSELPKSLSVLSIRGCSSLKRLPTVQGLTNISVFELYDSAIEEIEGVEGLKALKRLDISNCKIENLNGIGKLTSLRSLILSDCDYLKSLPDLSNLKLLKVLEIRQCKRIHQVEGLEELTSLETLNISECPAENSVQVENVMARSMVT